MKRVLITGANKGIGLATVKAILEQQDDVVVLMGSRDSHRGQQALESLIAYQPQWQPRLQLLELDVTSESSISATRDCIVQAFDDEQPLYGLVNNAGIGLGSSAMSEVIAVNTLGVTQMCDAFMPLIEDDGRLVNVSSASAPKFVSECDSERQAFFQDVSLQWPQVQALIEEVVHNAADAQRMATLGLDGNNAYGFSKACVSLYTVLLARDNPRLRINACTPGYIETDLTRPVADARGIAPADLGMKAPAFGTISILHLLFGQPHGSGHYYGSDAKRSPLDRYRAPGDPEYTGN